MPAAAAAGEPARVTNLVLPSAPGDYVLADGGGERFGGNTFMARNANTTGQFLFIITEGGGGGGVGAHFHARHFENFFALDGETLGWANGRAASLKTGDYFQAPPRHLHGFRLAQEYNRFAAFLTPGIFETVLHARRCRPQRRGWPCRRAGSRRSPVAVAALAAKAGAGVGAAGGADMFRALQMSGRGPDGYPLDVHPAKLPLPPQDPVWTQGSNGNGVAERAALLAHAEALCGIPVQPRDYARAAAGADAEAESAGLHLKTCA